MDERRNVLMREMPRIKERLKELKAQQASAANTGTGAKRARDEVTSTSDCAEKKGGLGTSGLLSRRQVRFTRSRQQDLV